MLPTIFMTDYSALRGLETISLDTINNNRVLRLIEGMMYSSFQVKHIPGKNNGVADFLSRLPCTTNQSDAPHYPRIVKSSVYTDQGEIRLMSEAEIKSPDIYILTLAQQASSDT